MALIDTTNLIDSAIKLKAKMPKNMVGDNYYLQSLQQKINYEWTYRYNVVDIEVEKQRQMEYTKQYSEYVPIETVVQHVITDKGEKLSDDWKKLVFKDRSRKCTVGERYRFSSEFETNIDKTEEEKQKSSSIWLTMNFDRTSPTSSVVVRRCNSYLRFAGAPNLSYENITEYHSEPCVVESDLKNIQVYMNKFVNVAQAEIYAIMQYNYFTRNIQINERFFLGKVDVTNKQNNSVFKIKAVEKFTSTETFSEDCPLVIVAFDRDVLSEEDDYINNIASHPTIYKVQTTNTTSIDTNNNKDTISTEPEQKEENTVLEDVYNFKVSEVEDGMVLLDEEVEYEYMLYKNNIPIVNQVYDIQTKLQGVANENLYYQVTQLDNKIKILNKRTYLKHKLVITFRCIDDKGQTYEEQRELKLGGMI